MPLVLEGKQVRNSLQRLNEKLMSNEIKFCSHFLEIRDLTKAYSVIHFSYVIILKTIKFIVLRMKNI